MFLSIYLQEVKVWLRRPPFYIYLGIMFLIAILVTNQSAIHHAEYYSDVSLQKLPPVNTPFAIMQIFDGFNIFLTMLIPAILGVTIHRDFKSEMYILLYSYPFTKRDYLMGKFWSGFTMLNIIVIMTALGMIIGYRLPNAIQEAVAPLDIGTYLHLYLVYTLPNLFLYGVIIFMIVTLSRNISAGFISIFIMVMGIALLKFILQEKIKDQYIAALLDPSASLAMEYLIGRSKSPSIPIGSLVLNNRAIWLGVASVIFFLLYQKFEFSSAPVSFNIFKKKQGAPMTKRNFGGITRIELPKVNLDFSFLANLKATWKLSNVDFRHIFKSPAFLILLVLGTLLNFFVFKGTSTKSILDQGSEIKYWIIFITILYSGVLVNRSKSSLTNHLIDATSIPNWSLWLSKLIAILKIQLLMLTLTIMVTGISYQLYKGHYKIEIGHYLFELYVLHFSKLMVVAMLSLFLQTLVRNTYVGLFLLFLVILGSPALEMIGAKKIHIFNEDSGFRYRNGGYGHTLSPYLLYRMYWLFVGLFALVLTHLFWVRGILASYMERLDIFRRRLDLKTSFLAAILIVLFVGTGVYILKKEKQRETQHLSQNR